MDDFPSPLSLVKRGTGMLQLQPPVRNQFRVLIARTRTLVVEVWDELVSLGKIRLPYAWTAAFFQVAAIVGCQALFMFGAVPGISVACLALVAVVISFRITANDFTRYEQAIWIILCAMFLYAEISSITTDRTETEARELIKRNEEREQFAAVIRQERDLNEKQKDEQIEQRQKFADLLEQGHRYIKNLKLVASNVAQATSFTSGGDSFPIVFRYELKMDDGAQRVGFDVQKQGKYPLYDLSVSVGRPYLTSPRSYELPGTTCKFSELNGSVSTPLLAASVEGEDSVYFEAEMASRNGRWNEVIDVRRSGKKLVSRWVVFESKNYGGSPYKVIFDLADADFPPEHRHDTLHDASNSIYSLQLPDVSQRSRSLPDVIFRGTRAGTGCFWNPSVR